MKYPLGKIKEVKKDNDAVVEFEQNELIHISDGAEIKIGISTLITRRRGGEFEDKAFYLNETYNWRIVTDTSGYDILVPTKK